MNFKRKNKHYVSPIDEFFAEFNRTHELSTSQQLVQKRAERIADLRDHIQPMKGQNECEGASK